MGWEAPIPIVWITKYALTQGLKEVRNKAIDIGDGRICIPGDAFYGRGEWAHDRTEAVKRADAMRRKKIESLRKQIVKLEAMRFDGDGND